MLGVLFLRKEQFHILLCFYDFLHLIPCLSVLWVECFFLGEQSRILCIQVFHFGQLFQARFIESGFRRLMQRDFFPVRFQKFGAVPGFTVSIVYRPGLGIVDDVRPEDGDFCHTLLGGLDGIAQFVIVRKCSISTFFQLIRTADFLLLQKNQRLGHFFQVILFRPTFIFQNPRSQFFNVDTTGEIAFGCENIGLPKEEIYRRIGQVTGELKIQKLLDRSLFALSGGEKQKIACASVSAMEPDIFVLDEPSSNLDVATIADLKQVVAKWKAMGKTVIVAEHRLYYLMDIADRVIYLKNGRIEQDMSAAAFGRLGVEQLQAMGLRSLHPANFSKIPAVSLGSSSIEIRNFLFSYGKMEAMNIPQLSVPQGAIVGILGDNGAGKTTFAKCLCGLEKSAKGTLQIGQEALGAKQRIKKCYMVMQDVNHQLFTESVSDEILLSMQGEDEQANKKQTEEILKSLNLLEYQELHPMSLSGGQKQRVAIGSAIASDKEILVFDEPTSGLDYHHMLEVAGNLQRLSDMGKTLFIITHDPELIAKCCNYFVFIEHGKTVWSGGWTDGNKKRIADFFSFAV